MSRISATCATYLYCLVRCPGVLPLDGAPPGLPGLSDPRALAVGDGLWLVAADAPLPEYGADSYRAARLESASSEHDSPSGSR